MTRLLWARHQDFIKFSANILNDCVDLSSAELSDGIFIETKDDIESYTQVADTIMLSDSNSLHHDNTLADNIELIHIPTATNMDGYADPNENIIDHHGAVDDSNTGDFQSLELIDCQIELMDQFKLTDHIDLCNNDIELNEQSIFGDQIIYDQTDMGAAPSDATYSDIDEMSESLMSTACTTCSTVATTAGVTKMATPTVANSTTVKSVKLNTPPSDMKSSKAKSNKKIRDLRQDDTEVVSATLDFNNWLTSVIERINLTMDYNDSGSPEPLVFSVAHVTLFSCKYAFLID